MQERALLILLRNERMKERKVEFNHIKAAALASGKYEGHTLFPDYFSKPKNTNSPMALADPNDEPDYKDVGWETPEQDEWIRTERLLKEYQESKVQGTQVGPDVPKTMDFDADLPPLPESPIPLDRDDLEWG